MLDGLDFVVECVPNGSQGGIFEAGDRRDNAGHVSIMAPPMIAVTFKYLGVHGTVQRHT